MRWRAALRRLWCLLSHARGLWCPHRNPGPIRPLAVPETLSFDWLHDYGPLWEPGSTAFWLEPDAHDQLAAWYGAYRPEVKGYVEAAGLTIQLLPYVAQSGSARAGETFK